MLRMLTKDLRLSPLRTFLTGFSMFVGIVAVILSVLSGTVGRTYLEATNEQLYGRDPTVYSQVQNLADSSYSKLEELNDQLVRKFPDCAFTLVPDTYYKVGLEPKVPTNRESDVAALRKALDAGGVETLFISPSYNKVFNLPMTAGRWLNNDENARFEIVVNKAAQSIAQNPKAAVLSNDSMMATTHIPVVGIVNDGIDQPRAYLNAITAAYYLQDSWEASQLTVYLWNARGASAEAITTGIADAITDTTGGDVSSISSSQPSSAFDTVAAAIQIAFAMSAALLLFVASIGLVNIGLASLEQRSRELLIRRALGATRASVVVLVLGGSLLLAIIVSILAIVLAMAVVYSLPYFLPYDTPIAPPQFPFAAAYISIAAGLLTATVGSLVPAIRAAKLQPALALR